MRRRARRHPAGWIECRSPATVTSFKAFKTEERQHSPSVFQLAEAAGGRKIVDFCYLSNKFFPTPAILSKLGAAGRAEAVRIGARRGLVVL